MCNNIKQKSLEIGPENGKWLRIRLDVEVFR